MPTPRHSISVRSNASECSVDPFVEVFTHCDSCLFHRFTLGLPVFWLFVMWFLFGFFGETFLLVHASFTFHSFLLFFVELAGLLVHCCNNTMCFTLNSKNSRKAKIFYSQCPANVRAHLFRWDQCSYTPSFWEERKNSPQNHLFCIIVKQVVETSMLQFGFMSVPPQSCYEERKKAE